MRGIRQLAASSGRKRPRSPLGRYLRSARQRAVLADARACGFADIPSLQEAQRHLAALAADSARERVSTWEDWVRHLGIKGGLFHWITGVNTVRHGGAVP
eukprot:5101777-Alexandrium_andersonii.AAC.1